MIMENQEGEDKTLIKYKMQLTNERDNLEPSFELASKLLLREIERIEAGGDIDDTKTPETRPAKPEAPLITIHDDKSIPLTVRVKIPVNEAPSFNFVGKLLGPKGATIQQLQMETMTKMSILGQGSTKEIPTEEDLKPGGKFHHMKDPLHVKIEVFAAPWDCYARMSNVLVELQKYLVPDTHDSVSMEQRQMMYGEENGYSRGRGSGRSRGAPMSRGRGRGDASNSGIGMGMRGRGMSSSPVSRAARRGAPTTRGAGRGVSSFQSGGQSMRSYEDYGYESYPSDSYGHDYSDGGMQRDYRETRQSESYELGGSGGQGRSFYDYGHASSAPNSYGERWEGAKAPPSSRGSAKSFRGQSYSSRPY